MHKILIELECTEEQAAHLHVAIAASIQAMGVKKWDTADSTNLDMKTLISNLIKNWDTEAVAIPSIASLVDVT